MQTQSIQNLKVDLKLNQQPNKFLDNQYKQVEKIHGQIYLINKNTMNGNVQNKYLSNKKYNSALRKFFIVLKEKVNERSDIFLQKLQAISIQKSPQLMVLKGTQFNKRVNKIFTLKLRQYWTALIINASILELQNKQKSIQSIRIKDRVYEAKVKSLRVLSRQWKQKKSQNIYKNKYFTPKTQQTPKMVKQKVSQQIYLALRNILRNKYLQVFYRIKSTQSIKIRNSKGVYLANYLSHKRKYWLTFGFEKLKVNVIQNRQEKNKDQIGQLDSRLVPVQDSQIVSLKQKQQKLQSALDAIAAQKQTITVQVQRQVNQIESGLQTKRNQIKQLQQRKDKLLLDIQDCRQKNGRYEFSRDEIFYLIYENFLINLRLWGQMRIINQDNIYLTKSLVLQWLQCPVIDFDFDKLSLTNSNQLNGLTQTLSNIVNEYGRLRKNDDRKIDLNEVFENFFSCYSTNHSSNNYQQFVNKIKFTCKMLGQVVRQNTQVMNIMLDTIYKSYKKLQGESLQLIQN